MKTIRSLFAAVFAASVMCLTSACITPLNYSPFGKDDAEKLVKEIDRKVVADFLKTKNYVSKDGEMKLEFRKFSSGESDASNLPTDAADKQKINPDELFLRATFRHIADDDEKNKVECSLPLLFVPFRYDNNKLFAVLLVDNATIVKDLKISPFFTFMEHPYYYIVRIDKKDDDSFSAQFVQFATFSASKGMEKENADVKIDDDGIVMNQSEEILKMLKEEKNYKLIGDDFNFTPLKTENNSAKTNGK